MIALLVVDVQKEYSGSGALPVEKFDQSLANIRRLLEAARSSDVATVVHIRHISRVPGDQSFDAGSPGIDFVDSARPEPGELVLTKHYIGSFSNPDLDRFLRGQSVDRIVICGYTSFICCDTTAREAVQLGYKVHFVEDAISEFSLGEISAAELHRIVTAVQGAVFSTVTSTDDAVALLAGKT
ncbi:Nicotinamidase-related amidase [Nonomuraea solani]|uniref:Nicotinamidase-related amidase n=1 Tax=Nonomuraea solani TaxID=1144553 RepID=A0A1H5VHS1_9ACTN|nr:isochorismatase family protein [Nonomuraea solani]SEF86879.1 Nicotinamidase-related amidase [Nonomuraea solani]